MLLPQVSADLRCPAREPPLAAPHTLQQEPSEEPDVERVQLVMALNNLQGFFVGFFFLFFSSITTPTTETTIAFRGSDGNEKLDLSPSLQKGGAEGLGLCRRPAANPAFGGHPRVPPHCCGAC